jgi:pimeloyl-ACP methyl ester carboxylesterase
MPYFNHDGLNFYFEEHGSGIPLLFSHGLSGSLTQSKELVGSSTGIRLIVYDSRGHGKTGQAGDIDQLNFSTMAADAAVLLDLLSVKSAVIGGVSMGAGIALAFCLRYPHRARAAILVRPAWLNEPAPPNLASFPAIAAMIQDIGIARARLSFERSDMFRVWKERYPHAANSIEELFACRDVDAIVATYQAIPRSVPYQTTEELKRLDVPTLVLANRADPVHPIEYAETLANALPNAQLRQFPSKSDGLQNHISAFRSCLRQFLEGLSGVHEECA